MASHYGRFGIERNDEVFNHTQWHESKFKYVIWDELIVYIKMASLRVIKCIKISVSSAAHLNGFVQIWCARGVFYRCDNLKIDWNWKRYGIWGDGQFYWLGGLKTVPR